MRGGSYDHEMGRICTRSPIVNLLGIPVKLFVTLSSVCFCVCLLGCESSSVPMQTADTPASPGDAGTVASTPLADVLVDVADPNSENVVTFGGGLDKATLSTGEIATLGIRARIADSWHIYAIDKPTGVNVATKLELTLPPGVEEVGNWSIPEAHPISDDTYAYDSDVTFRIQLKVTSAATPGPAAIECKIGHQACTDAMCRPPASTSISIPVTVQ